MVLPAVARRPPALAGWVRGRGRSLLREVVAAASRPDLLSLAGGLPDPALFPADETLLRKAADKSGLQLDGPHWALLVQGDDEIGVLAPIHERLYLANVNVYAASGVSDGRGGFGYVIYVRPEQFEQAAKALNV